MNFSCRSHLLRNKPEAKFETLVTTEELDDIIFFRTGNKKWSTNSPFKEKFPLTIKNIIHCIDQ